jgi:multidrug efflux system membrane fusion protein
LLAFIERRVVACIVVAVLAVFGLYEISALFFAYSGDAYVDNNVVLVAPQVSGPLVTLAVRDDSVVKQGDLIAEIDRTPFAIAASSAEAQVKLAADRAKVAAVGIEESQASVAAAQASFDDAAREKGRADSLSHSQDISAAALDNAQRNALVTAAELRKAQGLLAVAEDMVTVRRAEEAAASQALAKAEYDLACTRITAPVAGRVAPLTVRAGDFMRAGEPLAAVVSRENWRIMAEVDERHLRRLRAGETVWFTIGSDPWRLHIGAVRAVAPGIARRPTSEGALPYIPLETNWIRLSRRFPVVVDIGELETRLPLYRGADARVLIWF